MTAHQDEAGGRGRGGKQRGRPQDERLTIALLNDLLTTQYALEVQAGVAHAAEECDVNLFCIAGGVLQDRREFFGQPNVLFDLVSGESVDGALVVCSSVGTVVGPAALSAFCDRFKPLPVVSIGLAMEGIPSAFVDNYAGMHETVEHLIEVHGRRRIAFIRGPEGHQEAELRYKAYTDALMEHDIPVDPELVLPGDFLSPAAREAIAVLLDERKADFDALVAANDVMALSAMAALHERGIRVPYDVAVAGFDDYREGWSATPPLTSVRQPLRETTLRAMELLLALIAGEEVPLETEVPTELVIRQSCGCVDPAVVEAALALRSRPRETDKSFEGALGARRADVVAEVIRAVERSSTDQEETTASEQMERWLDAFVSELAGEPQGAYLMVLDEILRGVAAEGGDPAQWQSVLSAQRHVILPLIADAEDLSRAENLWQQARVLIAEASQRAEAKRRTLKETEAQTLRRMSHSLTTAVEIGDLVEVLARDLPRVGIERFYLALHEGDEVPAPESRLILAYDEQGRVELDPRGTLFPSRQLIPSGMCPEGRRWTMVVEALHFREEQLGFCVFERGSRDEALYEALRGQISGALKGTLFAEERQRLLVHLEDRAVQLQTAAEVSRAASSILDAEELMQQVVDLVRERFALYYVGLFLADRTGERTDEAGRWAVLRAATGEAGRQLLAQEFKLEVGGESMTGWCIANEQARVVLDAGADELRLENPLLPETRSEVALPLKVGERVLGALTVQSDRPAAFGDDDVTVLQTVADQLAVAIENARVHQDLHRQMERLKETQAQLVQSARLAAVGELAAGVAHEINNPMTSILVLAGLLQEDLPPDSPLAEELEIITNEVYRISRIVRGLLDFARQTRPERDLTDLNRILGQTVAVIRHYLEKRGVILEEDYASDIDLITLDGGQMKQVFLNLISNGAQAMPEGGTLRLRTARAGDEIAVSFTDTGEGIPRANLERIFDPFFSTRPSGTGLGLSVSLGIVQAHKGRITVETEEGRGSTFTVWLPVE